MRQGAHRPWPSCQGPGVVCRLSSPRTHGLAAGPTPKTEGPTDDCPKRRRYTVVGASAPAAEAGRPPAAAPAPAAAAGGARQQCVGAGAGMSRI